VQTAKTEDFPGDRAIAFLLNYSIKPGIFVIFFEYTEFHLFAR